MTADGSTKEDVKVPEGQLGDQLTTDFEEGKDLVVIVQTAMGEEACIQFKEAPRVCFMFLLFFLTPMSPSFFAVMALSALLIAPSPATVSLHPSLCLYTLHCSLVTILFRPSPLTTSSPPFIRHYPRRSPGTTLTPLPLPQA